MKKVLIINIRLMVWVAVRFIVATHIFACIWIAVQAERIHLEEIQELMSQAPSEILSACLQFYEETVYFVVMT